MGSNLSFGVLSHFKQIGVNLHNKVFITDCIRCVSSLYIKHLLIHLLRDMVVFVRSNTASLSVGVFRSIELYANRTPGKPRDEAGSEYTYRSPRGRCILQQYVSSCLSTFRSSLSVCPV